MEISSPGKAERKFPGMKPESIELDRNVSVTALLQDFMSQFDASASDKEACFAQGLYGYTAYDAIPFFDQVKWDKKSAVSEKPPIALMRYRLYQYLIAINFGKSYSWHPIRHRTGGTPHPQ
jgi:anthranilate synthase component 1